MLNITCTFCRAPINLNDDELALIMQEIGDQKRKSYMVTCYTCRRGNKVPVQRISQAWRLAGSPAAPEPVELAADAAEEVEN